MQLSTLISFAVTAVLPGLVETVLCLPLLLSVRGRALFRSLPPTDSVIISYVLAMVALTGPFIAGIVAAFGLNIWQRPIYDVLTQLAFVVSLSYLVVLPVTAVVGLPRYGIDWDPTDYGIGTWVVIPVDVSNDTFSPVQRRAEKYQTLRPPVYDTQHTVVCQLVSSPGRVGCCPAGAADRVNAGSYRTQ